MSEPVIAYIGLGANLGEPSRTFMELLKAMDDAKDLAVRRVSNFYSTEPVTVDSDGNLIGPEDQPTYLNAVAEIQTPLPPRELLAALHDLEAAFGRDREQETRWGPRTCDLDLLLYGDVEMDEDDIMLPHPRMHLRRFVLEPLAELAPNAIHPRLEKTIQTLLDELPVS